jgi:hypothetical protein
MVTKDNMGGRERPKRPVRKRLMSQRGRCPMSSTGKRPCASRRSRSVCAHHISLRGIFLWQPQAMARGAVPPARSAVSCTLRSSSRHCRHFSASANPSERQLLQIPLEPELLLTLLQWRTRPRPAVGSRAAMGDTISHPRRPTRRSQGPERCLNPKEGHPVG